MYLIEILHQTTTLSRSEVNTHKLYLIEILHQTTTASTVNPMRSRCILSKFYIKPQHGRTCFGYNRVVSYRNSTSNHNILTLRSGSIMLYLIEILHQTTTTPVASGDFSSCILSKFYIKPQHFDFEKRINYVVSYRNSTSNHNFIDALSARARLYLIEILHQTTTYIADGRHEGLLYLIEILHQTTTTPGV